MSTSNDCDLTLPLSNPGAEAALPFHEATSADPSVHDPGAPAADPPAGSIRYEDLAGRFRPIFERIARDTVRREKERELLHEPVEWLRQAGFGALRIPKAYGGSGATVQQLFRLMIELGEADSNLPQLFRAHLAFVEGRLLTLDKAVHDHWFPKIIDGVIFGAAMSERGDSSGGSTALTKKGEAWLLSGQKYYCTGTIYADWIAASAVDGEERVSIAFPAALTGVSRIDDWDGFGQKLTGSGTTKFEGVKLPEESIIRRWSEADQNADSYIKAFYQLVHLAGLAGIGRAVVRDAVAFVQPRTRAFGTPGKSSPRADPLVQRVVGRLASLSFSADCLVDGVAAALDEVYQKRLAGRVDEKDYVGVEIKAFEGQQMSIATVLEATSLLFEVGGASATSEARALDRHWRNARTIASHNPAIYRERAIGDYLLNGTRPDAAWRAALVGKKENTANGSSEPANETERVRAAEAAAATTV